MAARSGPTCEASVKGRFGMTTTTRRTLLLGGGAMALATVGRATAAGSLPGAVRVLASSDLSQVLPEILNAYDTKDAAVGIDYRSAADVERRLRAGARSDIVLGADDKAMLKLASDGVLSDAGAPLAEGRLALVVNRRSPLADDFSLGGIADAARNNVPFHFAIADPDSTPYGGSANDVLERWSIDVLLRPRFVYAEDVAEAIQLVASGQVAVGLVPKSLTASAAIARTIHSVDIPHGWHRPLVQRMALVRHSNVEAQRLYRYLESDASQSLLAKFGYAVSGRG